jgi:hypothetical protein
MNAVDIGQAALTPIVGNGGIGGAGNEGVWGLVDGVVFSSGYGVSLSVAALDSEVGGGFVFRYPRWNVPCSCGKKSHDA